MIGCWLPWVAGWMGPCPASRGCRIRQTRTVPPVSCACASRRWHIRAAHIWCPDNCILPKAPFWPLCFLLLLLLLSRSVCVCDLSSETATTHLSFSVFIHTENDTPSVCVCVYARNPNLQTKYLTTTTTTRDTSSKQARDEYTRTITRDSFEEDLEQEKNYPTNDKRQQPEATSKLAIDTQQQQQQTQRLKIPNNNNNNKRHLEQASKQASYNKLQHNNSQESRLQRRGHRGEQKWQQQRTLSKISQLLLEMYKCFHNSLFSLNQTKPKKKDPSSKFQKCMQKMSHTHTHTHTHKCFFYGTIVFGPFFVFVDKRKIGKIVELFFFVFLT